MIYCLKYFIHKLNTSRNLTSSKDLYAEVTLNLANAKNGSVEDSVF